MKISSTTSKFMATFVVLFAIAMTAVVGVSYDDEGSMISTTTVPILESENFVCHLKSTKVVYYSPFSSQETLSVECELTNKFFDSNDYDYNGCDTTSAQSLLKSLEAKIFPVCDQMKSVLEEFILSCPPKKQATKSGNNNSRQESKETLLGELIDAAAAAAAAANTFVGSVVVGDGNNYIEAMVSDGVICMCEPTHHHSLSLDCGIPILCVTTYMSIFPGTVFHDLVLVDEESGLQVWFEDDKTGLMLLDHSDSKPFVNNDDSDDTSSNKKPDFCRSEVFKLFLGNGSDYGTNCSSYDE